MEFKYKTGDRVRVNWPGTEYNGPPVAEDSQIEFEGTVHHAGNDWMFGKNYTVTRNDTGEEVPFVFESEITPL